MTSRSRAALYLLLLTPAATLGTLAGLKWGPGTTWGATLYLAGKAWILLLPLLWLLTAPFPASLPLADRLRQLFFYRRFLRRIKPAPILIGTLLGLLVAAAILTGYYILSVRGLIDASALLSVTAQYRLNELPYYLTFAVTTSTLNALLEEYTWRWFVVSRFEDLLGLPPRPPTPPAPPAPLSPRRLLAAALASLCFTAHHVVVLALYFAPTTVFFGSLGVFLGGLLWSLLFARYRSLLAAYLCHILADVAIFYVGWQILSQ